MGLSLSTLWELFSFGKQEMRIVMIGLDGAGKTSILYKLKIGDVVTTIPTIGFNVETVEYRNIRFTVWDVGGQFRIRQLWHHYYRNSVGVIFVIDSTDEERIFEAANELHNLLDNCELENAVLLVLANKQDLPNALSVSEITNRLELPSIRKQDWHIHATCAHTGEGLYESLERLRNMVLMRKI